jgi:O-antigen/teichoic acid export membrane protein
VLRILLCNQVLTVANATSFGIAYGTERHRPLAVWAVVEAIVNLVLSVLLVRRIGLYGVAWGTVVAGVICLVLFWPRYISRLVDIPIREYLWKSWGWAAIAAIPFGIACVWEESQLSARTLTIFFLQVIAIVPFAVVGNLIVFRKEVAPYLNNRLPWAKRLLSSPSPRWQH